MAHLTYSEILTLVDHRAAQEKSRLMEHVSGCQRCSSLLDEERRLAAAVREVPLVKPSRRLTTRVMEEVLPDKAGGTLFRLLSGGGRIVAMAIVLVAVGYALSLNVPATGQVSQSSFVNIVTEGFRDAQTILSTGPVKVSRDLVGTTDSGQATILLMMIAAFAVLGLLDRFVLRRLTRLKL